MTELMELARAWLDVSIRDATPLAGGKSPIWRLQTTTDSFVLKDLGPVAAARLERLDFDTAVMDVLAEANIAVPRPLQDKSGRLWSQADGHAYILYSYLESGAMPDRWSHEWWGSVGAALADLHQALQAIPISWAEGLTWREELGARIAREFPSLCEKEPQASRVALIAAGKKVMPGAVSALTGLPAQVIHRDAHPGNLSYDGNRVSGFLDCNHFCIGPRVMDLAYWAVHMIKWAVKDQSAGTSWLGCLPSLMTGYCGRLSLSQQERLAIPYAMLQVVVMFAVFASDANRQTEVDAFLWLSEHLDQVAVATRNS